jgi:uncharacterized OB-fold protein
MQKALAPEISTWPDANPQLIGSKCGYCGVAAFPVQPRCPRCSRAEMSVQLLPRRGKLEFGMEVELAMVPFATDANGDDLVTFAFQPVQRGSRT